MPKAHRSRRARLAALSAQLRREGWTWSQIARRIQADEHINARVALRLAHGWTQEEVAQRWNDLFPSSNGSAGITNQNISSWENWPESGHEPSLKTLKRLAQVYQCDVGDLIDDGDFSHLDETHQQADLAHAPAGEDATVHGDALLTVRDPDTVRCAPALSCGEGVSVMANGPAAEDISLLLPYLNEVSTLGRLPLTSARDREYAYDNISQLLARWADTVKRRELLRILGTAASYVAAVPLLRDLGADEQQRAASSLALPSRIDSATIGHIEAVLWHCKRQDDLLGPQTALHTVVAERDVIRWLLPDCPGPFRPRLLSALSHASRMAGWLCFDLGDYHGAWLYYDQARAAAHEARNSALAAQVLCNMSHLATWQGTPRLGIDHAVAAQGWARQTDDLPLRAYAHQVAARAYAADGGQESTDTHVLRELGYAEECLAGSHDDNSIAHFNGPAQLASDEGLCYLLLGQSDTSASKSSDSLELLDRSFVRNAAFTMLTLGQAHLQGKVIPEAAIVISDAAELAMQNRSVRLTGEMRTAVRSLAPWNDVKEVRELTERCQAAGILSS
jgi:transcriptional regulator with XRE-family HTH domain